MRGNMRTKIRVVVERDNDRIDMQVECGKEDASEHLARLAVDAVKALRWDTPSVADWVRAATRDERRAADPSIWYVLGAIDNVWAGCSDFEDALTLTVNAEELVPTEERGDDDTQALYALSKYIQKVSWCHLVDGSASKVASLQASDSSADST